jgi:hypothetical protein
MWIFGRMINDQGEWKSLERKWSKLFCKSKAGKAIPLQFWTGPEDSRSLRLPDFKIIGTLRW